MSMSQFPIIAEVSVVLTDGELFARLSGPTTNGAPPTKEWLLEIIAKAIVTAEDQMPGLRLPTPREFTQFIASERGLGRIAVTGGEREWQGFTREELDAAIIKNRAESDADDGDEDDG